MSAEVNGLYEHGSALGSSNQSVNAGKVTAGVIYTKSWLGHGDVAQSNSVAVGAWFFHEEGTISGTGAGSGRFETNGVLFGLVFGYRIARGIRKEMNDRSRLSGKLSKKGASFSHDRNQH